MTCGGVVSALSLWLVQVPRHYWEFEKVGTLCAADDSLKWTVLWTLDRRHWSKRMIGNEVVSSAGASEQRTKEPPSDGAVLVWRASVAGASVLHEHRSRHRPAADRAERPALGYGAHVPNHLNLMLKRFDGHLGELGPSEDGLIGSAS
jgi:hypothetical protein